MRSAVELYEYAKALQPKWEMSPNYFEPFIHQLNEQEEVLFSLGCMGIEDGNEQFLYGNGSGVVITTERVIIGGYLTHSDTVFGFEELVFEQLEKVGAVRKNLIMGFQPMIDVDNGRHYGFVLFDSKNAKKIGKTMQELVKQQELEHRSGSGRSGGSSLADEIRKLKSLLDEGVLSEEEFASAKKKLLG